MISANGWFVTAKHVLEPADGAPLSGDGKWFYSYSIAEKEFHPTADVAAGRFELAQDEARSYLLMGSEVLYSGTDVIGWGFAAVETDDRHLYHDIRFRKGYVQRTTDFDIGPGNFRALELSFDVLGGMSGAPILLGRDHRVLVGVMFGSARSEAIEDFVELETRSEDGGVVFKRERELRRVDSFGLACRVSELLELDAVAANAEVVGGP